MKIERSKKWLFGVAVAVIAGGTTWLAAVPGPGTGHSFTPASLASPFTQDLYATTGNLLSGSVLGGVAFAPDGRVWSAECRFIGTRLHRFASATTSFNGSNFLHQEELVVDLTAGGPLAHNAGGCGLVNHPDGSMYSNSTAGIWRLDATTGQYIAGPFGHGGNALGIAVDPQTLHLVYVGNDCHYQLGNYPTCTLWDWDPATPAAPAQVFARLSIPASSDVLIDGIYFDPTGAFLFAAHREEDFQVVPAVTRHGLQIITRPTVLKPANAAVDDTQLKQFVPMVSEPDGVAFHAGDGFVVTLNESGDCEVNGTNQIVASNPNTGACLAGTTSIGGTMTRFDFANGYALPPTATSVFASGGFRGDLAQVGADGCIYATQAPLFGGTSGTRYDNDITTGDNSLVQICGGFVPPPGVTTEPATLPGTIAGLVFLDANHNGVRDSGEGALAGVPVTLSTDSTPQSSAADGTFKFEELAPGTYTVTTPATATYLGGSVVLSTAGSSGAFSLAADEDKTGLEFGYAPGSVAGTVFVDLNHNQVRDGGEPPLSGVTVTLAGAAGGNAISAVDGSYKFNLLTSGDYTVTVPATAGALALTTVGSRAVTLTPGEDKTGVDFGYAPPLAIACLTPATGQVGVPYSGSAAASGGLAPYTYAIVGTLPAGLTLNAATGEVSGTPTATGGTFSVTVTDGTGATASTATSACPVNGGATIDPAPLVITCVSPATGQVGVAYSGSAVASGGVTPYTYAIVGTLPAGLTLNASTGQISGTPTAAGSFSVKVTDSNGAGASTATSACSVTIAPPPPPAPTLYCAAATTGQVGVAYTSSLIAMGGVGSYSFSIVVGSLPTGLTLNASTGAITGTPTAAGSFPFTAKVVDSRGSAAGTSTNSCGITIATSAAAYATYTQGGWGSTPNGNNPGMLLRNNFAAVYPNGVTIGGSPYYLKFTSQSAIEVFLPAGGKPGVLNKSATNPASSSANVFAGQVLALRLSVDFSNAGITTGGLSSLKIATGNPLAGSTVTQVLALANQVIAGNTSALPAGVSVSSLNDLISRINQNYDNGTTNNGILVP